MKFSTGLSSAAALLFTGLATAAPIAQTEIQSKAAQGLRLLHFAPDAEPEWHTEDEVIGFKKEGKNFFDVTNVYKEDKAIVAEARPSVKYDSPSHQDDVKKVIDTLKVDNMKDYLKDLSDFNNRYYKADTGEEATQWIIKTIQGIIDDAKPKANVTVERFDHSFKQGSIIAKIPGSGDSKEITILGAHMDSINLNSPSTGRAPGQDDDGSGTVNLIEAFRALLEADFEPSSPVEFQWYAGEEAGLLGSQDIAESYKDDDVEVKGMLQFDMTAYFKPGSKETISLMPDYIDEGLTTFVGELIDEYSTLPHDESPECGYACSDHASWYNAGYPTALPFETRFGEDNPSIHSEDDTTDVDGFSWDHTFEYTKLAVAFAYELGA